MGVCRKFCPKPSTVEVNADEILGFAKAVSAALRDPAFAKRMCDIIRSGNVETGTRKLKRRKLQQYCYQLCVIFCAECCEKHCHKVCPPDPLITRVGSIPISQIDALGYGSGPSIPNCLRSATKSCCGSWRPPFWGHGMAHGHLQHAHGGGVSGGGFQRPGAGHTAPSWWAHRSDTT